MSRYSLMSTPGNAASRTRHWRITLGDAGRTSVSQYDGWGRIAKKRSQPGAVAIAHSERRGLPSRLCCPRPVLRRAEGHSARQHAVFLHVSPRSA